MTFMVPISVMKLLMGMAYWVWVRDEPQFNFGFFQEPIHLSFREM